ncbi:MAG: nucleotidyltransferase domain-containing protein [Uliginosibacterium sp.]|nr:nucleotidyltransferase domain-containing protein [Uliginosibacterium sp.]
MTNKPALLRVPIDDAIRTRVLQALDQIESEHDVKVLFACESGSRGWGFASPDSDYDVRFVYVNRLPWYLTVEPQRDVIELPISDELDVCGWDVRKALQLLRKSNPTLLEWLDSPVVYREDAQQAARMRALAPQFFSALRGRYHYPAMAKRTSGAIAGESVRLKKYLCVLRPLLAVRWIDAGLGMPPMRFADLAAGVLEDHVLIDEINRLLAIKMRAGEAECSPRWPAINAFIEAELESAERNPDYKRPQARL